MAEMRRKKRRSSNDFLWVLIILLIICLGVLGRQEYKIYQINKEMSATQQRVDELKKVQAELEAERKRLDDLKYIEKLAREDHNMVGKNEVPLFIVDEQEKQQKQETEAEEKKKQQLYSRFYWRTAVIFYLFSYICTMQLTLILKEGYNTYCIKIF